MGSVNGDPASTVSASRSLSLSKASLLNIRRTSLRLGPLPQEAKSRRCVHQVMEMTEGAGVDVAIEAAGIPAAFDFCQEIVGAGGR